MLRVYDAYDELVIETTAALDEPIPGDSLGRTPKDLADSNEGYILNERGMMSYESDD